MKYSTVVVALAILVPFSGCSKRGLSVYFEDAIPVEAVERPRVLSKPENEGAKGGLFVHEAVEEQELQTGVDDVKEKGRLIYPTAPATETISGITERTANARNAAVQRDKVPQNVLIALNDVRTADEFLRRFVVHEPDDETYEKISDTELAMILPSNRRNGVLGKKALSAGFPEISVFAGCKPQKTVVKVMENSASDGIFLWPPCVYVNRCGGCCTSELMTCRPTSVSSINVTVLQARYTAPQSNPFINEGMRTMSIVQHDKCACGCKELPEDCTLLQEYRENECRCICANQNEATRCQARQNKFWDSLDCTCKCRSITECSSGLYFNTEGCRCEVMRFAMARIATIFPDNNVTKEVSSRRIDDFE